MPRLQNVPSRLGRLPAKRQQAQAADLRNRPGDPYKTYAWQQMRREHLDAHPHCVMCLADLGMMEMAAEDVIVACATEHMPEPVATVCDHIKQHRIRQALASGDPARIAAAEALFWDRGNLQSLCAPHHDSTKQRIERGSERQAIGLDGCTI